MTAPAPRRYTPKEFQDAADSGDSDRTTSAMLRQAAEDALRLEQIEQAAQRVVHDAMKARGPMDWLTCMVCGLVFHPPAVHLAHPTCPIYELQELLSSSAGRREEPEGR